MPFKCHTLVVGNDIKEEHVEERMQTSSSEEEIPAVQNEVSEVQPVAAPISSSTPTVIINGKQKKLGKHSAYLLDMLTLDEE